MEEALNKLSAIGAVEISKETHISVAKVESILAKDFGKLDKAGAIGFIQILEREYKVDFSEWIEEFRAYHENNGGERSESEIVKTSFVSKKEEVEKNKKSGGGKSWFIILILLLIAAAAYYFLDWKKITESVESFAASQGLSEPQTENVEIQEVETLIPEQEAMVDEVEVSQDANMSETLVVVEDETLVESSPAAEVDTSEEGGFMPVEIALAGDENASSTSTALEQSSLSFSIDPKGKLWLGIIDIQNAQKSNIIISSQKDFNITEPLLILTGHGNFSLIEGEEAESHSGVNPVRLKVDPKEGVKVITLEEFKALNGGKSW